MKADISDVRKFWTENLNGLKFLDTFPSNSDEFWSASEFRYRYHYHLPPLFDRIAELSPVNSKLLEIGCGMGDDTAQWAKRGFQVTAIDLTETAVECTKIRLKECGLHAEVQTGNAEGLEFPDDSFDIVYSFGVLHHSPDTPETIKEVYRVLKPGGRALIMLYHRNSLNYFIHRLLYYPFDGSRRDPCPVEYTYNEKEIYKLFSLFASCKVEVEYLFGTGYGLINSMIPRCFHQALGKRYGWHLMIEASKS